MKSIVLFLFLILMVACTGKKATPEAAATTPAPHEQETDFKDAKFRRDLYQIRGQVLDVVIAEFDDVRYEYAYMLLDDGQEKTFLKAKESDENLISYNLTPHEKETLLKAQVILSPNYTDNYIQSMREDFDLTNVLSLDRCRSNPIWKDLSAILKSKRNVLYLAYRGSWPSKPHFAIRWDLEQKKFSGAVQLSSFMSHKVASDDERKMILWPLLNPELPSGDIATDSFLLWPNMFLWSCNESYAEVQGKKALRNLSFQEEFLPFYEPSIDERASVWSDNYDKNADGAFAGNIGLSILSYPYSLNKNLKDYARKSPIYTELYGEQK